MPEDAKIENRKGRLEGRLFSYRNVFDAKIFRKYFMSINKKI